MLRLTFLNIRAVLVSLLFFFTLHQAYASICDVVSLKVAGVADLEKLLTDPNAKVFPFPFHTPIGKKIEEHLSALLPVTAEERGQFIEDEFGRDLLFNIPIVALHGSNNLFANAILEQLARTSEVNSVDATGELKLIKVVKRSLARNLPNALVKAKVTPGLKAEMDEILSSAEASAFPVSLTGPKIRRLIEIFKKILPTNPELQYLLVAQEFGFEAAVKLDYNRDLGSEIIEWFPRLGLFHLKNDETYRVVHMLVQ